jgi:hypothetical protein
MKKIVYWKGIIVVAAIGSIVGVLEAGVPFTNLEGVGGAAFNPLAYPANPGTSLDELGGTLSKILGKPQIGAWYVNLGEAKVDWTSIGISETIGKRLELSYGHEVIAAEGVRENISKDSLGAKFLLIEENTDGNKWIPAVSVGVIGKHTSDVPLSGVDSSGYDTYLVATKLITDLPIPVLVSGGLMSTDSQVTGVYGYSDDRDTTLFANLDLIPIKEVAVGVEYKQGAEYHGFKNADYWDAHVAWFVNKNLTIIAAYVNAGDLNSSHEVGLGDGVVLSLQYQF